ncbi:MAG: hypothetical protein ACOC2K_02070 [Bacteroidota bacterium]
MKQKIRKLIKSKSFWGAVLFAMALWGYTSLNSEYSTRVQVPLDVQIPRDRAIETPLPDEITIEVHGMGWHLFNLIFFNSSKKVEIDLSNIQIQDSVYRISRNEIMKGIRFITNVEQKDVIPENLLLKTGAIGTYKIPVRPDVEIQPREGFALTGDLRLQPDSVTIKGNDRLIRDIKSWKTVRKEFSDVRSDLVTEIMLLDTFYVIVSMEPEKITLRANIQQSVDLTFYDVPVEIEGGQLPKNHKLMPPRLNLTVRGGIERVSGLSRQNIKAYLTLEQIINDTTGILMPSFIVPDDVELLNPGQIIIYHTIDSPRADLARTR